ncbi:MAG: hypothetical protein OXL96_16545 [Candidatus Poribacteria bacterium]|nr:hypothetical protein [Candidatus Poribacteria bacterium]
MRSNVPRYSPRTGTTVTGIDSIHLYLILIDGVINRADGGGKLPITAGNSERSRLSGNSTSSTPPINTHLSTVLTISAEYSSQPVTGTI